MSNIDFSQMITSEAKSAADLITTKVAAEQSLIASLAKAADAITGPVPQAERDSWPTKATAARAWVAGTATTQQIAMLEAECAVTSETRDDLAASILTKADAYSAFAASLSGQRRIISAAITDATTQGQVQAALDGLAAQI